MRVVILIDALVETPKDGQKPPRNVISKQLSTLPEWLRLFVTSHEEPMIEKALSALKPEELRADAAKNSLAVEVSMPNIACIYVRGQVNMADFVR